jgi:L-rhamnose mutarotase
MPAGREASASGESVMADTRVAAFKMRLKPGAEAEYRRRHEALWPDLAQALTDAGIFDYHIFLDPQTLDLFAFARYDLSKSADDLPSHPVMRRWWDYMAPLMEVEPGNRPTEWPLERVFHFND